VCDLEAIGVQSIFKTIHIAAALARMLLTYFFGFFFFYSLCFCASGKHAGGEQEKGIMGME
jgi:hypothetical protein